MRTFHSEEPGKGISHPTLKTAAGSEVFVLRFIGHTFETNSPEMGDALAALLPNLQGVTETTPKAKKAAPNASQRE